MKNEKTFRQIEKENRRGYQAVQKAKPKRSRGRPALHKYGNWDTEKVELLSLINRGFGLRALARHFKVSVDSIRPALKRLNLKTKGQSGFKPFNEAELAQIKEYDDSLLINGTHRRKDKGSFRHGI